VLADVIGRKRVITAAMLAVVIPMALIALATSLEGMIVWRFLQGLLLPPIFAVAIAYVGDEWPTAQVPAVAGLYVTGASIGGFCGRFVPGVLADLVGWRSGFLALAAISLAGAIAVAALLPRERSFMRSEGLGASVRQMLRHLRNPQLLATYAIGFGVLFNFIAVFTYVNFHLAAPPYSFSPTLLGTIFVTYLAGSATAPLIGWAVVRFGRRPFILGVLCVWACGALLLLAQPLAAIILGLLLCAVCGMLCQAISTGYVTAIAKEGRSSAVGLYVTAFYVGGSVGALLPGLAWSAAGWPACVAMALAMLTVMAAIAALAYRHVAA
jgi:MFS transporter, YNFM family, putative membrane transport protein